MGRGKIIGTCRLCGERKELTFEHIPPKSSFNRNTGYHISPVIEVLESKELFNFKGQPKQGGIGKYSLCGDCNSFLGINYVDSYNDWVKFGLQVLNSKYEPPYSYTLQGVEPLKIIKQIFSMFISMGDEDFFEHNRELCEFVRNPISNELPEKYQIHTYLFKVGNIVYIPPMCIAKLNINSFIFCSELTFIPYGYVLSIDYNNSIENHINITSFKNFKYNDLVNVQFLGMHVLQNHLPFPLDGRTKEEINEAIQRSKRDGKIL